MNTSIGACKEFDTKEQGNGSKPQMNTKRGQVATPPQSFACMGYVSHLLITSALTLELTVLSGLRQIRPHVESHR